MTVSNRTVAVSRKVQKRFILVEFLGLMYRIWVQICVFFCVVVAVASRFFFFCQINRTKDLHKQNKKTETKIVESKANLVFGQNRRFINKLRM